MSSKSTKKIIEMAKAMIGLQQEANKPAVQAYQEQIPQIQQAYQQQGTYLQGLVDPLKQRYDNLINQIKGNQQVAENRQTVTTNNELGRRGILGSSGLAQQEITKAVNPITGTYTGMIQSAGSEEQQKLSDLANQIAQNPIQESQAIGGVNTAIGQLKSGAASTGIGQGLTAYQQQQQLDAQKATASQNATIDYQKYLTDAALKAAQTSYYNARTANVGGTGSGGAWS